MIFFLTVKFILIADHPKNKSELIFESFLDSLFIIFEVLLQ